jgi:hypothetical protein
MGSFCIFVFPHSCIPPFYVLYSFFISFIHFYVLIVQRRDKYVPLYNRGEIATYEKFFWSFCGAGFCKFLKNKDKKFIKLFRFFCKCKKVVWYCGSLITEYVERRDYF